MVWKEIYQLGIESIDEQHKMLFKKIEQLIGETEGQRRPEIYKQIIKFLKEYVVFHFQDEEAYFESIGYADAQEHKKQQRDLTAQVEKYAAQLEKSQYDFRVVKRFVGMLSAWLIYHVADEDLKYTGRTKQCLTEKPASYIEYFTNSTIQVLEMMAGLQPQDNHIQKIYDDFGETFIEIGVVGQLKGRVVFGFSKEFAIRLVERMVSFAPIEIDELVCSALAEISNITSGNGTIAISQEGTACDICPPKILEHGCNIEAYDKMRIDTAIGPMVISVSLC